MGLLVLLVKILSQWQEYFESSCPPNHCHDNMDKKFFIMLLPRHVQEPFVEGF